MIDNTVTKFCSENGLTISEFYGKTIINRNLQLYDITAFPEGFNPTINGYLNLCNVRKIPSGFNPIIGGDLNLHRVIKLPKGFSPIISGSLTLTSLEKLPSEFNPIVGGFLFLPNLKKIPKDFNLIIGGDLCLDNLPEISKRFIPTIGGNLYIPSVKNISNGFDPNIVGNITLNINLPNYTRLYDGIISWNNSKYILVNNIFTEVLHISSDTYVYTLTRLNQCKVLHLVTDNLDIYVHGDDIDDTKKRFYTKRHQVMLQDEYINASEITQINNQILNK